MCTAARYTVNAVIVSKLAKPWMTVTALQAVVDLVTLTSGGLDLPKNQLTTKLFFTPVEGFWATIWGNSSRLPLSRFCWMCQLPRLPLPQAGVDGGGVKQARLWSSDRTGDSQVTRTHLCRGDTAG